MKVAEAQELWSPVATYLNTASYGLPPRPAWDSLQSALEDWHGGRTSWEHWGIPGEEARAYFARLVGVPVESVAIGPNVSTLVGFVAASIPDGSRPGGDPGRRSRWAIADVVARLQHDG